MMEFLKFKHYIYKNLETCHNQIKQLYLVILNIFYRNFLIYNVMINFLDLQIKLFFMFYFQMYQELMLVMKPFPIEVVPNRITSFSEVNFAILIKK